MGTCPGPRPRRPAPTPPHIRANLGVHGDTDADHLVGLAAQALDELQDYISEATHDPWPGTTAQPRPYARIHDTMLHLGYGDPDAPVLACAPVPIAALEGPHRNQ